MAFNLIFRDQFIAVKTAGRINQKERHSILKEIAEVNKTGPLKGILIDHRDAMMDMSGLASMNFADELVPLKLNKPGLGIYVVASYENRADIDLTVMPAICRGVPIQVCESRDEAVCKMSEKDSRTKNLQWLANL